MYGVGLVLGVKFTINVLSVALFMLVIIAGTGGAYGVDIVYVRYVYNSETINDYY
jgi:hypothetical protein